MIKKSPGGVVLVASHEELEMRRGLPGGRSNREKHREAEHASRSGMHISLTSGGHCFGRGEFRP